MQSFTEQMTQAISIPVQSLAPANINNNTTGSIVGPVNMREFRRIMGHVEVGVLTGAANVQVYFQASNANNGTFVNVASGPTLFINTNNTEGTIEMRADQVPAGDSWVQLCVLVSANSAFVAAQLYGGLGPYAPTNQSDANSTIIVSRNVM